MKYQNNPPSKKIEDYFYISRESVQPNLSSDTLFFHYSLPAFDANGAPIVEYGKLIQSNKNKVFPNSILVSKLNPRFPRVWKIKECGENSVCSTEFVILRFKNKKDEQFIDYFASLFSSKTFIAYLASKTIGTSSSHQRVKAQDMLEFEFNPLPESKMLEVNSVFSHIDSKLALNSKIKGNIEEIVQELYKRWFIDFEFPDIKGKPYKSNGGAMVASESGKIPIGWEVEKLEDYVNITKGCSYRSEDLFSGDNALVTIKAIERGGGFKPDGLKQYGGKYLEEQVVQPGEIVVAHTDLTQKFDILGKPAIVRGTPSYSKLIASLDLAIIRPKNNRTNVPFIYFVLKGEDFQNHAHGYANGTTVLHLSKRAIPSYKFILPPKEILGRFNLVANLLLDKTQNCELESETLMSISTCLIPKLITT